MEKNINGVEIWGDDEGRTMDLRKVKNDPEQDNQKLTCAMGNQITMLNKLKIQGKMDQNLLTIS